MSFAPQRTFGEWNLAWLVRSRVNTGYGRGQGCYYVNYVAGGGDGEGLHCWCWKVYGWIIIRSIPRDDRRIMTIIYCSSGQAHSSCGLSMSRERSRGAGRQDDLWLFPLCLVSSSSFSAERCKSTNSFRTSETNPSTRWGGGANEPPLCLGLKCLLMDLWNKWENA